MIETSSDVTQGDTVWKKQMAIEEIMDLPGLSKIKDILERYNLSSVTFDFKLNVYVKHTRNWSPRGNKLKEPIQ